MPDANAIPLALVVTIVGAALGLWWRIEARIGAERAERVADFNRFITEVATLRRERIEAVTTVQRDIDDLRNYVKDYQLEVTKNFVPTSYQTKMEDRFIGTVDKLASRLETVITRMEGMANQLASMSREVAGVKTVVEKNGH